MSVGRNSIYDVHIVFARDDASELERTIGADRGRSSSARSLFHRPKHDSRRHHTRVRRSHEPPAYLEGCRSRRLPEQSKKE